MINNKSGFLVMPGVLTVSFGLEYFKILPEVKLRDAVRPHLDQQDLVISEY